MCFELINYIPSSLLVISQAPRHPFTYPSGQDAVLHRHITDTHNSFQFPTAPRTGPVLTSKQIFRAWWSAVVSTEYEVRNNRSGIVVN